ncbi:DUF1641 domain-containing protein [Vulcanisaeta distributa]|uniref:DUF1641 domain-containing protein n=1 Tax=Vulcanisaeta distributa (strain DSM 14429 / JCM 11212 / NBRC 100878 / IC-017) TaxID=572478 RepID=E1QPH8_VULDI|nr:DUF1641 domain-containing protein [Vulcanisaeta distributa]ADN51466.1 hypothetical protein Vdis_2097 [Vulcanisaeta distributa DSM 14429]
MSTEIPTKVIEELIKDMDKDKAMIDMLNKLLLLYKSGAFDTAVELLMTVKNVSSVITDSMIDNLALTLRELAPLIDALANNPLLKLLGESLNDTEVDKAIIKAKEKGVSLGDVIGLMRNNDVLTGLYVFLTVMKSLGRKVREFKAEG